MAATLVTLAQAKTHLRITDTDHDTEVQLKLDQAEAIILDYLKNPQIAISTVTAANPAIVTTVVPHSLRNGATYSIGGTTTTPTIVGAQVVTVTGLTTFTVPVNVTAGQSTAAGYIWTPAFTPSTVALNVTAAILLMLGRLYDHRGDDEKADVDCWLAIERLLMR